MLATNDPASRGPVLEDAPTLERPVVSKDQDAARPRCVLGLLCAASESRREGGVGGPQGLGRARGRRGTQLARRRIQGREGDGQNRPAAYAGRFDRSGADSSVRSAEA